MVKQAKIAPFLELIVAQQEAELTKQRVGQQQTQVKATAEATSAKSSVVEAKKAKLRATKDVTSQSTTPPPAQDDDMFGYWQDKDKPGYSSLHRPYHSGVGASNAGRCVTRMSWLQRALGYEVKGDTGAL